MRYCQSEALPDLVPLAFTFLEALGPHGGKWVMLARLGRRESFDISPPVRWRFVSLPQI
jgi:hypothetical protein